MRQYLIETAEGEECSQRSRQREPAREGENFGRDCKGIGPARAGQIRLFFVSGAAAGVQPAIAIRSDPRRPAPLTSAFTDAVMMLLSMPTP